MDDIRTSREQFQDGMRKQTLTVQKLAELADIAPAHVKALIDQNVESLPPAPYVRGYVIRIAEILELDPEQLWEQYKTETDFIRSGNADRLPINRFAPKPINKRRLIFALIGIVVLAIAIPQIADFLGKPSLTVSTPATETFITDSSQFVIAGSVRNSGDKVLINAEEVVVESDGSFKAEVLLQEGQPNDFIITARRFLGRETSAKRSIILKRTATSPLPSTSPSPLPSLEPEEDFSL